jgi:hypothetical protein
MHDVAGFHVRVLALLTVAVVALGGCAEGRGVLEVTVENHGTQLAGVARLQVNLRHGPASAGPYYVTPNSSAIPPPQTFALVFDAHARGPITVSVDALDADKRVLAGGMNSGEVKPSSVTQVTVVLNSLMGNDLGVDGPVGMDLTASGDLAGDALTDDLTAPPDLSSPGDGAGAIDAAAIDQSIPDMAALDLPDLTCAPESDPAFCARLGKTCGFVSAPDNCGVQRKALCGTCANPTPICTNGVCAGCVKGRDCSPSQPSCINSQCVATCTDGVGSCSVPGFGDVCDATMHFCACGEDAFCTNARVNRCIAGVCVCGLTGDACPSGQTCTGLGVNGTCQ